MNETKDCHIGCSEHPPTGDSTPAPSRYFAFRDPSTLNYCGSEAAEALDQTNWDAFKGDAEEAGAVTMFEGYQSDPCWGCWHWEPGNTAAEELFEQLGAALADYPVLDEWAYGALESDAWWAYWSDMGMTDFCATRLELSNSEWFDVEELLGQDLVDDLSEKIVEGMNHYDGWTTTFDVHGAGRAFDEWVENMTVLRTFAGTPGVEG